MAVKKNENAKEVKKVETPKEEKIVQETVTEEVKAGKRLTKRKSKNDKLINLDRDRVVPVVSVSNFTIGYKTKETHTLMTWNNYGDEHQMKIGEVLNMFGDSEKYLKQPWLIIDDEEFVEAMDLNDLYDIVFDLEDLEKFFAQPVHKIKEKLEDLSVGMRSDVLNRAVLMINNGEIDSVRLASFLKNEYKLDINI